jgi:glycosyltransferase involved in cell wall biosynthesis
MARKGCRGGFTVNASRIGERGGLRIFTEAMLHCLETKYDDLQIIVPPFIQPSPDLQVRFLPHWLSSSSRVSRLRPLLWLTYATFLFPAKRSRRILSTTHHVLPFRRHQIVTVHDLRPYFQPDTWLQKFYFHFLLPRALRRCDGILTVSETSKLEIISVYKIDSANIHVVPNAIDAPLRSVDLEVEKDNNLDPYLLMVGASWKHKNAMEVLEQYGSWSGHFRLKILAGAGQYSEALRHRCSILGIETKVEILKDASDSTLASLYRGCAALVYPSTMEGFGLPPLEAMAWGKPVIVSDIPVFHELLGDVPIYVKLGDPDSWNQAFADVGKVGTDLKRVSQGVELASSYSRERMGRSLEIALESIWNLSADPIV